MDLYDAFSHLLMRSKKCKVVLKYVSCTVFFAKKNKTKQLKKIEQVSDFFKSIDLDNMIKCRFDAYFESSIKLDEKIKIHDDQSGNASIKRPIRQGFELNFDYETVIFNFYDDDFDEKNLIKTNEAEMFEFLFWTVLNLWFNNETPNITEMKIEIKNKRC